MHHRNAVKGEDDRQATIIPVPLDGNKGSVGFPEAFHPIVVDALPGRQHITYKVLVQALEESPRGQLGLRGINCVLKVAVF